MSEPTADDQQRERLILEHLPLVRALVARFGYRADSFEDLVQVGTIGVIKAVDRFDPRRGTPLGSFVTATVVGELRRHFRDHSAPVRVPRGVSENRTRVMRAIDELTARAQSSPGVAAVAAETGLNTEEVLDVLAAEAARTAVPLSESPSESDDGPSGVHVGSAEPGYEIAELRVDLEEGLSRLPARERVIIHLRFNEDLTQSAIAERLGISQMHVSRLLRQALRTVADATASQ